MATTNDKSTYQQPLQEPQMAYQPGLANGNAVPQQHNGNGIHEHKGAMPGKWSDSLFSCFKPMDICCMGYWCPCVLFGKTHARLEDPTLRSYSPFNGMCIGWCVLLHCGGLQCILQTIERGNMRNQLGIQGDGFTDFMASWCCACCGIIQQEKEAIARTQGGAAVQGYQQNPQMSYN